jgi:hypothetical protein
MKELVFTEEQTDQWVYYESDTFWTLKQMLDAVGDATTWGEFRAMLPEGEFETLSDWNINGGEKIYWDGSKYLFIEKEKLPNFLEEAKKDEDYFIVRHDSPFNNSWFVDACWPSFEIQLWDEFPEGFIERFQRGKTWLHSKPYFNKCDFDGMEEILTEHGYDIRNIGYA